MLQVILVDVVDRNFLIKYSDGTVSVLSPNELATRLSTDKHHSLDVELEASQVEAIAALAVQSGQTVDEFVESAILEKLLRDQ